MTTIRVPRPGRRTGRKAVLSSILAAALAASCSAPPRKPAPDRPVLPPSAVITTESWTFGVYTGRALRTAHYRLFTTVPPSFIADRLPTFLEASLTEYRTRFAPLSDPPVALDTYVVANRTQWIRLTARLLGDQAANFQVVSRAGVTTGARAILFDIGTLDTFALAAHEGWHQFTQSTFAQPLPTWLEEGLATTFEGFLWDPSDSRRPLFRPWANLQRFDQLRAVAAGDRLLPLTRLLPCVPGELAAQGSDAAVDYYAQVWAAAMFLREGEGGRYSPALNALIADAASGNPAARARFVDPLDTIRAYFTPDLEALDQQYRRFVDQVVRTGAKDQITAGHSPLQPIGAPRP